MIKYEGDRQLLIYLSSGEILELSEDELIELHTMSKLYFDDNPELMAHEDNQEEQSEKRRYNKKERIITLFKKYKSKQKTKSAVFREISKELNISYKAVQTAYYRK